MDHQEIVNNLAHLFIDAGYQVKKNFDYSFTRFKGEIDVMALDLDERVVILCEVKSHHTTQQYRKAIKQLEKHQKVSKNLGFKNWNVYKLYISYEREEMIL